MTAPEISGVPDADLGSLRFWGPPAVERDRYFEMLRREAPISRHEPPEDILGLGDQGRLHHWAIVRYEDIRTLPAGEKVVLFYHSGNRDERAIDRPWDFDVSRDPTAISALAGAVRTIAWARTGQDLAARHLQRDAAGDARYRGRRAPSCCAAPSSMASSGCRARSPPAPERRLA